MSKRRKLEQISKSFTKKINNFLHNSTNLPIHGGIARQGSRKDGTHKEDSDLDMVFAISGDPKRDVVYPDLCEKMKKTLKVDVEIGKEGHVINVKKGVLDVDLVLLETKQFDKQVRENKLKRIED
jgi:predicted nucleotidyltransferase